MIFSNADIQQITERGISLDQVHQQLDIFKKGTPYCTLVDAATISNGILKLSEEQQKDYALQFEKAKDHLDLLKFVPASGAASRMFNSLFKFLNTFDPKKESFNTYIKQEKGTTISHFFFHLEKFPFHTLVLEHLLKKYPHYKNCSDAEQKYLFVRELLSEEGYNYGDFPKALLPFHKYETHLATAFEAHLFEAALYASSKNTARLHFTITEKYLQHFTALFNRIQSRVEKKTGVRYALGFSTQKQHTDTLAVHTDNSPYRKKDNRLLFRPSGHGALLENLNDQDADLIFIKNIDNVVVSTYERDVAFHKKVLAGKLLEIQKQSFAYAQYMEGSTLSEEVLEEIQQFLSRVLHIMIPKTFKKYPPERQRDYLKEKLNRPIRVCGMVKSEGDPGGGPFWVKDKDGISLQIVETAQISSTDTQQQDIRHRATHFNPVDMVCGIKNYKGEKYHLPDFADHHQAFITQKSKEGNTFKVLERPGLWNGSMAYWNSVFVEVPVISFNPVKTITDLLKPAHQVK